MQLSLILGEITCLLLTMLTNVKADTLCIAAGGACDDVSCCARANYRAGLCSGGADRKCCFSTVNCLDSQCNTKPGQCGTDSCCSSGASSGLCSGPSNRKCCSHELYCPGDGCTVRQWSGPNFIGDDVYVEDSFIPAMNIMSEAARACNVKVYVTHSWRKVGATIGNTVVSPSSNSNHLVGMAIDMNLDTPAGWCNSVCLNGKNNGYATCFIGKIKSKGLTWGGDWSTSDPVHIDNRRNQKSGYSALRNTLQAACTHVPMS